MMPPLGTVPPPSKSSDLTVQLTLKGTVTAHLPSGRVLTLSIESGAGFGPRYLMMGSGRHSISTDPSCTSPERLRAHWDGYVATALELPEEVAAAAAKREAFLKRQHEATMERASAALTKQAEKLTAILKGPKEAGLRGPGGITISLRACEVFPLDPGEGTPAMVNVPFKGGATYWCACDMGIVTTDREDHELSPTQVDWLNSDFVSEAVNGFVAVWTKRIEKNPALRPSRKNTH